MAFALARVSALPPPANSPTQPLRSSTQVGQLLALKRRPALFQAVPSAVHLGLVPGSWAKGWGGLRLTCATLSGGMAKRRMYVSSTQRQSPSCVCRSMDAVLNGTARTCDGIAPGIVPAAVAFAATASGVPRDAGRLFAFGL